MQTMFWSRRRLLGAVAAATAVAATPFSLARPARAADGEDPADGSLVLPDTDRAKVVKAWSTGGRATKAAAAYALYGTDADVRTFLTETLPTVVAEDNRVAVSRLIFRAGKGTRREASAALDNGDAAVAAFLGEGYKPALLEDLAVATSIVSSTGGKGVRREASAALDTNTQQALEDFLVEGQYTGALEDAQVQVAAMMVGAGPEVKKYADRALSGTASDVQWFLDTGQHIARARDQESATIAELVAVVEREGTGRLRTNLAVSARSSWKPLSQEGSAWASGVPGGTSPEPVIQARRASTESRRSAGWVVAMRSRQIRPVSNRSSYGSVAVPSAMFLSPPRACPLRHGPGKGSRGTTRAARGPLPSTVPARIRARNPSYRSRVDARACARAPGPCPAHGGAR